MTLAQFFRQLGFEEGDRPELLSHNEPAVAAAIESFGEYSRLAASSKSIRDII